MVNKENNIPEEYLVMISGKAFDKRDPSIVKDFVSEDYIHLDYSRYMSFSRFHSIELDDQGRLTGINYNYGYTSSNKKLHTICLFSSYNTTRKTNLSFIDTKELEEFLEKYNFKKGEVLTGLYFHESCKKFDKKHPYYFSNMVKNISIRTILNGQIELTPKSMNTTEYKELQDFIFSKREEVGMESRSFRSFEGLQYTFGIELETVSGVFEDYPVVFKDINVASVFDGSLRDVDENGTRIGDPWGAEYVTGVLKGDAGLKHVNKLTEILNTKCTVDKRCAFHVHIGSLKWNSEEIVYCYLLGLLLEQELFSMMPKSRRNNEYCKSLPILNKSAIRELLKAKDKKSYKKAITLLYNQIFKIVASKDGISKPSPDYNKKSGHPLGRHGGYNRETDHRYSWLNFTNIIFNQRGNEKSKTIEFRCHSGTLAYKKIHNWIKICMAFVEYVHNHKKDILDALMMKKELNLEVILKSIYPKSHERLIKYVELRKNLFSMDINQEADYIKEESNLKNIKEIICV